VAGLISASVAVLPQESRAVSFTPVPGDFTGSELTLVDNAASNLGLLNINSAAVVGDLYTQAQQTAAPSGIGGFGGFFQETYLSLGALGGQTIGGSIRAINSTARSTNFALSAADIAAGIDLRFNYAVAGFAANGNVPLFKVTLRTATGFGGGAGSLNFTFPTGITSVAPPTTNAFGVFRSQNGTGIVTTLSGGSGDLFGFGASDYFLEFALDEPTSSDGTNAAAGFNQFRVTAVPFDFDPSVGIAILGAGFGLNKLRKNLKAKKDTIV
jgi:hypothetical protein